MRFFRTFDTAYSQHNGTEIKAIIRQLDSTEADEEVGKMFEIELITGETFHCFEDEILVEFPKAQRIIDLCNRLEGSQGYNEDKNAEWLGEFVFVIRDIAKTMHE